MKGHFFKCCPQRQINSRGVHEVTECAASSSESEDSPGPIDFFIGTITGGEINSAWFSSLDVEGTLVKFKLDTGAEVNVLPTRIYSELKNKPPLTKTNAVLSSYGEFQVKTQGKVNLECRVPGLRETLQFYVASVESPPILGLQASQNLNLVKKIDSVVTGSQVPLTKADIVNDYPDVFKGLGSMDGTYHIELDETVEPVIHPPRKVPYSLLGRLQDRLKELETLDVYVKPIKG